MIRFLAIFILFLAAGPIAMAQDAAAFASGCADDRGADRCSPAAVAAWNERYGLDPIGQMATDGATVRRVLFVDGYGSDLLAISAIRAKGAPPMIELRRPRGGTADPLVRARPISESAWNRILAASADAHRRFERAGDANGADICLHAWVYRYDAADPRRLSPFVVGQHWDDSQTHTATASACGSSPTSGFADVLADAAVDAFAECSAISMDGQRNTITLLATCLGFSGDVIAAAHASKGGRELHMFLFRNRAAGGWADRLQSDTSLSSESLRSKPGAAWNELRKIAVPAEFLFFDVDHIQGIDAQRARMTGTLSWRPKADGTGSAREEPLERKLEIMWVEQARDWVINDVRIID